ncbi:MAG: 50S ribosomal protein L18 [Acholeplasmatales bacterium]|jgi:large subunit ribosomal protein L18|nr:50S ribosomal protein L18 [Acholeplasmatales bacterium]
MFKKESKNDTRLKRHLRIRQTIIGSASRPRLVVYRSNTAIYGQIIDDTIHHTLVSANSKELNLTHSNIETSKAVGKLIAEKAVKTGITKVVFDRAGYLYHGKIKAFAEAAREAGLIF